MTIRKDGLTRRHYLAATGAVLTAGLGGLRLANGQAATIRQGYQPEMHHLLSTLHLQDVRYP